MAKAKGKPTNEEDLTIKKDLQADMRRFGFLLPTNDEELEEFEKIFGKTQVMFPEHLKRPAFLNGDVQSADQANKPHSKRKTEMASSEASKKAISKPANKNDYFKKLVLAAEIAYQLHEEPTFGHIKFVKLLYLCNQVCEMRLSVNFGKYAAGPLDGKLIHTIDAEFKRRDWFSVTKQDYGYRYEPGENINDYKSYYSRYFNKQLDGINSLIELFREKKSDFCEIIATIYYLLKEFNTNHKLVNDASLIEGFYAWDERKRRFKKTEILNAIEWMNKNGIVP